MYSVADAVGWGMLYAWAYMFLLRNGQRTALRSPGRVHGLVQQQQAIAYCLYIIHMRPVDQLLNSTAICQFPCISCRLLLIAELLSSLIQGFSRQGTVGLNRAAKQLMDSDTDTPYAVAQDAQCTGYPSGVPDHAGAALWSQVAHAAKQVLADCQMRSCQSQ